jgi:hypothetical protein
MSGRGYAVRCPQCKRNMARSHFGVRGGTHKICFICRQSEAKAVSQLLKLRTQMYLMAEERRKEEQIKQIAKEFARETASNQRSLHRLHRNLNPTEATLKAIEQRTQAQEMWQVAHDVLIKRIEKGENIYSIQQYFEGEP